jgi:hypothetical protein
MTQTVFGQSDAAALELVTALNAASAAGTFCLTISAQRLFARLLDLPSIPAIGTAVSVQVFPGHDQTDRDGLSGIYDDIYGVHVLILQKVAGAAETQVPLLMQLRSQISEFLCSQALTLAAAVHPMPTGSKARAFAIRHGPEGIYDLARLESSNVFYSDMIVTYKAGGMRRRNG